MGKTGDRRLSRRYRIVVALRYRVSKGGTISRWRAGKTSDLSSTGVSFRCRYALRVNALIEMVIDWPSKPSALQPVCLRAEGHVARSGDGKVAVWMTSCRIVVEHAASPRVMAAPGLGM